MHKRYYLHTGLYTTCPNLQRYYSIYVHVIIILSVFSHVKKTLNISEYFNYHDLAVVVTSDLYM